MSGTARTIAALNLLLPDNSSGLIDPVDIRDVVATLTARTPFVNVMFPEYGALNTGTSHPLSGITSFQGQNTTGWNLTQWRTIFPAATATTNELDWCAAQKAINALTLGGTVWFPAGTGYIMSNANSAGDGSGTLALPTAVNVSLMGDYSGAVLSWPSNIGSGKAGILCGNRTTGSSVGYFRGLTLNGPGTGNVIGTATPAMQGIMTNDRRVCELLLISNFYIGINVVGGQTSHSDIRLLNCGYGYYFDTGNSVNFGNMSISRVVIDSSMLAAIGVHHTITIDNTTFYDCFTGTAPFGIYKETNGGAPTQAAVVNGCNFINHQFENIGNAAISDDTANNTTRVCAIYGTNFFHCQFHWGAAYKWPAKGAYAIIDVSLCKDMQILGGIQEIQQVVPGTVSTINILGNGGLAIEADIDSLIANAVAASLPLFSGNNWFLGTTELRQIGTFSPAWRGSTTGVTGTCAAQDCAIISTVNVTQCTGTATECPVGVLRYRGSNNWGIVATSGQVVVKTSGTVTAGLRLFTSTAGATLTSATTTAPIGIAVSNNTTNRWNVWLRGLM